MHVLDKQFFGTFNFMHCVQKEITCKMHGSHKYQRIRIKTINVITYRLLLIFPKGEVMLLAGKLTTDLAESNVSLPLGLWLNSPAGWLPRDLDHLWAQYMLIEYVTTLPFYANLTWRCFVHLCRFSPTISWQLSTRWIQKWRERLQQFLERIKKRSVEIKWLLDQYAVITQQWCELGYWLLFTDGGQCGHLVVTTLWPWLTLNSQMDSTVHYFMQNSSLCSQLCWIRWS